jgi:OOP family OmpA-OmpF porin
LKLRTRLERVAIIALVVLLSQFTAPTAVSAQDEAAWVLQPHRSLLRFQTIKNGAVIETNSFRKFDGTITEHGTAQINIALDSVDTKVDLRNVRLRFLFFETFKFPTASINAQLDPSIYDELLIKEHLTFPIRFSLNLHGVTKRRLTDVIVTMVNVDTISVATVSPVIITASDFALGAGIEVLKETANVDIIPVGLVTLNFVFGRKLSN